MKKEEAITKNEMPPPLLTNETAIIVVDMWDTHWFRSMASRLEALLGTMVSVLAEARRRGIQVIFAPADVHNFYQPSGKD